MYIFNTQLVHHKHSQFGDLGSTHLGRTGAASSSPRSEKSETLSSESSTYWGQGGRKGEEEGGRGEEEGGVGEEEGGVRRSAYTAGCLTTWRNEWKALNSFLSQLRPSQVSENNNSTYSFWHKEMCEKHTLCCKRKVQPVYSEQLHRVLENHIVAIMTTPLCTTVGWATPQYIFNLQVYSPQEVPSFQRPGQR